jgi:hypothetical protein
MGGWGMGLVRCEVGKRCTAALVKEGGSGKRGGMFATVSAAVDQGMTKVKGTSNLEGQALPYYLSPDGM